ncbi:37814_t:CDS:2, partial [Gigaspora margarita]
VFLELDEPDLFNLGSVSRYYNILTADNGVWSQLALKRWEAKEGMREISEEYRNFWFKSPGAWKRVYCLIEKEARRTSLDVNDLVDNIWYCAPVDNIDDWNNNKLVTFSEDGTYTHHHEPFNPTFTWTMNNGSLSLNYKPFRLMRSSGWDLVMSNGALVFKSPGTKSFRRKLREDGLIPNDNNF